MRRNITTSRHANPLLCLANAVRVYMEKPAHCQCRFPAPMLPRLSLHYLIRDTRGCDHPVHVQQVSNHNLSSVALLPSRSRQWRLRARTLDSYRAMLAGASVDEVVTDGC